MQTLIRKTGKYLSFIKFSHTVFAMPFALIGFSLGVAQSGNGFNLRLLVLIILCMIFARSAAMAFNRLADRGFDALNPRTGSREIPAGKISPASATVFVAINCLLFIITTGFINRLTLLLSPVALIIILGYSYTKRITYLCHFILGLGLSLAPIGAYISVTGKLALLPVIYSLIVLTWSGGFDIIYALQDEDFDRENKLFSIPSVAGKKNALVISAVIHLVTFLLIITAGIIGHSGLMYWSGAAVFSLLLIYQHLIVKPDDLSKVTVAFQTTNGIASIIYALFAIPDLFLK